MSVRSIDGSGNNETNPDWGKAETPLRRKADADYPDGSGETIIEPPDRPNPRVISNTIAAQGPEKLYNDRGLSDLLWQWGQFIDHDIALTPMGPAYGTADIPVDPPDPLAPEIPFNRSEYQAGTGTSSENPRQQINAVTAFLDGSHIYGSDTATAAALRTFSDGMLITSDNMLPMDAAGYYMAGDERVNEQIGLTAMHTLFVREHNRLAGELAINNPGASDEDLYQHARKIVGAEIQSITYKEFLPALLGPDAPSAYAYSYNSSINPAIANSFSTAFYRLGHSMLASDLLMVDDDGTLAGSVPLRDAYFTPDFYSGQSDHGNLRLDQILKGLASQRAQEIDNKVVDDVRNFLFGPPGGGGLDLASLNIQRGRDHGLPDYNSLREAYDLDKVSSFDEITSDTEIQAILAMLYDGDIGNIDVWVGALAEDHRPGSSLGELMTAAMVDQFVRLRDGDSFFYLGDDDLDALLVRDVLGADALLVRDVLDADDLLFRDVQMIIDLDNLKLSDVIRSNTYLTNLRDDVFVVPVPPTASLVLVGLVVLLLGRHRDRSYSR